MYFTENSTPIKETTKIFTSSLSGYESRANNYAIEKGSYVMNIYKKDHETNKDIFCGVAVPA